MLRQLEKIELLQRGRFVAELMSEGERELWTFYQSLYQHHPSVLKLLMQHLWLRAMLREHRDNRISDVLSDEYLES